MNCPYCGCNLKKVKQNDNWHEKFCPDHCTMKYHQFFQGDFDSGKLQYIKFHTADFHIYVYFEDGWYTNLALIYSEKEVQTHGKAGPILKIPSEKIHTEFLEAIESSGRYNNVGIRDWLTKLNDKLNTLALFI